MKYKNINQESQQGESVPRRHRVSTGRLVRGGLFVYRALANVKSEPLFPQGADTPSTAHILQDVWKHMSRQLQLSKLCLLNILLGVALVQ